MIPLRKPNSPPSTAVATTKKHDDQLARHSFSPWRRSCLPFILAAPLSRRNECLSRPPEALITAAACRASLPSVRYFELAARGPAALRGAAASPEKKARDNRRGQDCISVITRVSLKVIGADGAPIERRQSGGLVARRGNLKCGIVAAFITVHRELRLDHTPYAPVGAGSCRHGSL